MQATKQWFPIVADIKKAIKNMPTESAQNLLQLVSKLEGVLSVLYPKPERKYFPKLFTIERMGDKACLQEEILEAPEGQEPLFCIEPYYDAIAEAVAKMYAENREFDRETLLKKAKSINERVTLPAVIVCIRLWMSINSPLFQKNPATNLYAAVTQDGDFITEAKEEWNNLVENPLKIDSPRKKK